MNPDARVTIVLASQMLRGLVMIHRNARQLAGC